MKLDIEAQLRPSTPDGPLDSLELPVQLYRLADDDAEVEVSERTAEGKPRKFTVKAHTGKIMAHPWLGKLAVDLAGMTIPEKPIPALLDHDPRLRVGRAEKNRIDPKVGLVSEIVFLKNKTAQEVLDDTDDGFPWQASVFVPATRIQRLDVDEEAEVNGQTMTGPGLIFRETTLREVSLTALGVDDDTSIEEMSAGGTITARLSQPTHKETTVGDAGLSGAPAPVFGSVADLRAAYPTLAAELVGQGTAVERARCVEILDVCHQSELVTVLKYVRNGDEPKDVFKALLGERQAAKGKELGKLADSGEEPVGPTGDDAARAAMSAEERAKADWEKNMALRAEFPDVNQYIAYYKNRNYARTGARQDA